MKYLIVLTFLVSSLFAQEQPKNKTNRNFWIVSAVDLSATFADALSTTWMQRPQFGCYESDPLYGGPHPSDKRIFMEMFAFTAAEQFISFEWRKHHKKYWALPMVIDTGVHVQGAVYTLHNCL